MAMCLWFSLDRFFYYSFSCYEYLKTVDYQGLALRALIAYSNFVDQSNKYVKNLYCTNKIFKELVDRSIYSKRYIHAYFFRYNIEPFFKNWVFSASLIENTKFKNVYERYQFNDSYDVIFDNDSDSTIVREMNDTANALNVIFSEENDVCEFLLGLKYESKYLFKIVSQNYKNCDIEFPIIPSNVKFINIEYTHPMMDRSIVISLDKSFYNVGNELLSSSFIKRFLSYQPMKYYFDFSYEIKLIDVDLKEITLTSDQYILLNLEDYEIINL
jgi:hypothetical protein